MNRLRFGSTLVILCLLILLGLSIYAMLGVTSAQHSLEEMTATQAQLAEAQLSETSRKAQAVVASRDDLLAQILDRMSPEQRAQWGGSINQLPDFSASPIALPEIVPQPQPAWGVFLLALITSLGLAIVGFYVILKAQSPKNRVYPMERETTLRAYKDLFSQPVDPIGELHVWRVRAQRGEQGLNEGIRLVQELEHFLRNHCGVNLVGTYGQEVQYEPDKQVGVKEGIPRGRLVHIVSPGWKRTQDAMPLRRPRVR